MLSNRILLCWLGKLFGNDIWIKSGTQKNMNEYDEKTLFAIIYENYWFLFYRKIKLLLPLKVVP